MGVGVRGAGLEGYVSCCDNFIMNLFYMSVNYYQLNAFDDALMFFLYVVS